jgi:hypothetical protein
MRISAAEPLISRPFGCLGFAAIGLL